MRSSSDDILKYIENEKDLSRYKISRLEKNSDLNLSKKRVIDIENEFINLPLEEMLFEDVADVAAAIQIYRQSRAEFYKTYKIKSEQGWLYNNQKTDYLLKSLQAKISFLEIQTKEWLSNRIEEVNLVQNSELHYELVKTESFKNKTSLEYEKRKLGAINILDLLKLEPATMAKKRARMQTMIFSIGLYLSELYQNVLDKINQDKIFISYPELVLDANLDENKIINYLEYYHSIMDNNIACLTVKIFKYYNQALKQLKTKITNTMGQNDFADKIHELKNLIDFQGYQTESRPRPSFIKQKLDTNYQDDHPQVGILYLKNKEKQINNKICGILFPIQRKGNEKTTLLYLDVFTTDGLCINDLLSNHLTNMKAINPNGKDEYYKAIMLISPKQIIELGDPKFNNFIYNFVDPASFLKRISKQDTESLETYYGNFIDISEASQVLIPKTRSEEESITEIMPWVNSKIFEFQRDYELI